MLPRIVPCPAQPAPLSALHVQAGRLQDYDSFRVGPFGGLTICFSGLSAGRKTMLAAVVMRGGGVHSPALDKKCTHLVTSTTSSEKYRWAAGFTGLVWVS